MSKAGESTLLTAILSILRNRFRQRVREESNTGGLDLEARADLDDYFDPGYYLGDNPDVAAMGMDPLEHYFRYGWREGRDPSPQFTTSYYLTQNPDVVESDINPLLHYAWVGRKEGRQPRDPNLAPGEDSARGRWVTPRPVVMPSPKVSDEITEAVSDDFDSEFYRRTYPHLDRPGISPVDHYFDLGWREGLNPSAEFDTAFYLEEHPDVADSGINPLLHYVNRGRNEGRLPRPPIRPEIKAILDQSRSSFSAASEKEMSGRAVFRPADLDLPRRLATAFATSKRRIVVSIGHDKYSENCGGIQILISDEQERFNADDVFYLNLSPANHLLALSRTDKPDHFFVNVTADGEMWGAVSMAELQYAVVGSLAENPQLDVLVVIHSLLGHSVSVLRGLFEAIENPVQAFFWLHDYFSLCPSYSLMRNDVAFCNAPPPDSPACSICVYGDRRPEHLREIASLFDTLSFTVIAPSELALDLWQSSSDLPVQATIVHPHLKLGLASHRFKYAGEGQDDDTSQQPLKVGFCGYPVMHKGWYVYQDLLDAKIPRDQPLEFYHFAEKSSGDQRLEFRSVRVTRDDRDAMVEAMRSVDLDLVIIPALWPETFCYVAHEAVAAGCVIATLESSGNVSALAHDLKQVLVYPDQQALVDACCDGSLYIAVREMLVLGVAAADLHYTGTTSTLKQVCE